jgi:hypothetical protein
MLTLSTEGVIRHRGRGYEMSQREEAVHRGDKQQQDHDDEENEDDLTQAQAQHAEELETVNTAGVGARAGGSDNTFGDTQETCESIFTSTPPRVGQKAPAGSIMPPPGSDSSVREKREPLPVNLEFADDQITAVTATGTSMPNKRERETNQEVFEFESLSY